jgi:hypothetical protein
VQLVQQVLLQLFQVQLARQEFRARRVPPVRLARQVRRVQPVMLVQLDPKVLLAQPELQVKQAHKVRLDKDLITEVHTLQAQPTIVTM